MGKRNARGVPFRKVLEQDLKDTKFRKAYEEAGPEVEFAAQIAEERERQHRGQKEIAKAAAIKQSDLSEIEHAKRNVTAGMMNRIAHALGCRVEIRVVKDGGRTAAKRRNGPISTGTKRKRTSRKATA